MHISYTTKLSHLEADDSELCLRRGGLGDVLPTCDRRQEAWQQLQPAWGGDVIAACHSLDENLSHFEDFGLWMVE